MSTRAVIAGIILLVALLLVFAHIWRTILKLGGARRSPGSSGQGTAREGDRAAAGGAPGSGTIVRGLAVDLADVVEGAPAPTAYSPASGQTGLVGATHDDLTAIEGIGPKLNEVLHAAGITTFARLASTSPDELRGIVAGAGSHFALADPGSWPEQAGLAAAGDWAGLERLQATLTAGRAGRTREG
jgi:predicted flap endonuclease-1-like 5' DNA nuclease